MPCADPQSPAIGNLSVSVKGGAGGTFGSVAASEFREGRHDRLAHSYVIGMDDGDSVVCIEPDASAEPD